MRKLSKSEKRLLVLFLSAIFIVFNLIGLTFLARRQGEFEAKLVSLRSERLEARSWLADKETWAERKEWLAKTQPKLQSIGEANSALLENLQAGVAKHSITILDQAFVDPNPQPAYQEIAVKLKVAGSLEAITRWLVELQQPENFQAIQSFSMKTDNDPSKIVCELTVARWYAPSL